MLNPRVTDRTFHCIAHQGRWEEVVYLNYFFTQNVRLLEDWQKANGVAHAGCTDGAGEYSKS